MGSAAENQARASEAKTVGTSGRDSTVSTLALSAATAGPSPTPTCSTQKTATPTITPEAAGPALAPVLTAEPVKGKDG